MSTALTRIKEIRNKANTSKCCNELPDYYQIFNILNIVKSEKFRLAKALELSSFKRSYIVFNLCGESPIAR